jgi:hypothetical protein
MRDRICAEEALIPWVLPGVPFFRHSRERGNPARTFRRVAPLCLAASFEFAALRTGGNELDSSFRENDEKTKRLSLEPETLQNFSLSAAPVEVRILS